MNPTIYEVVAEDPRQDPLGYAATEVVRGLAKDGKLYASHYARTNVWTEPMFVCPVCGTAQEEHGGAHYECPRCTNQWLLDNGHVLVKHGDEWL